MINYFFIKYNKNMNQINDKLINKIYKKMKKLKQNISKDDIKFYLMTLDNYLLIDENYNYNCVNCKDCYMCINCINCDKCILCNNLKNKVNDYKLNNFMN